MLRHGELADVMEQRSHLYALSVVRGHPERPRETSRVQLNAPDVMVGRLILRVDRKRERLDRRKSRRRHVTGAPRHAARDGYREQRKR